MGVFERLLSCAFPSALLELGRGVDLRATRMDELVFGRFGFAIELIGPKGACKSYATIHAGYVAVDFRFFCRQAIMTKENRAFILWIGDDVF